MSARADALISRWDCSTTHPPDLGWRGLGNDGTGIGLVAATDIVDGIAGSMATRYNGTDERTDMGDIGEIRTIAFWVRPDTATEEFVMLAAGQDIMVNAGTITYTGLTPDATYVNGTPGTTLVANEWRHVVCVLDALEDANDFRLATDGVNYGAITLDDVRVYGAILTNLMSADLYVASRQGRTGG